MLCQSLVRLRLQSLVTRSFPSFQSSGDYHQYSSAFPNDIYRCNLSITSCFKHGDVENARRLFDEMPHRNLVTWNCMISGYVRNYRLAEAQRIFDIMPERNVVSWSALMTAHAKCGMLKEARNLFDGMPERNIICWNSMITGYIDNGRIEMARELFNRMPMRNAVSWAIIIGGYLHNELVIEARKIFDSAPKQEISLYNVLLSGYVELGYLEDAFNLFSRMPQRDNASWTTMITCYSRAGQMENARNLFMEMPKRCVEAWTAIIQGYLQIGEIKTACELFNKMPERDIVAWNSMVSGYVQNGMLEDALQLFLKMPKRNIWSWNAVLQGYVQQDDIVNARNFFEKMPSRDETSWNTIISGYGSAEALILFSRMIRENFKPDQGTFSIVVSACASLAALDWGRSVHLCAIRSGYEKDMKVTSSLITMYSKCGLICDASQVFGRMLKRDTVAWNAMIGAQAYHGSALEALGLFCAMIQTGFEPDSVTFLGLLSACAHKGLVDKGWEFFNAMQKNWNLIPGPEHYTCMVDLLGRSGLLNDAYEFIRKIPVDLPTHTWETLLSACRVHGNLELGEFVAEKVLSLQPLNSGVYVLLSSIYAAKGMWEDAARIRVLMKENAVKKEQACSWIEIKGKINTFIYNDRSHPQIGEIYKELETLVIMIEEIDQPLL